MGAETAANTPPFATSIKLARIRRGFSVAEAAQRTDYSEQQWRNFEGGSNLPQLNRLQSICDELQLDLASTFSMWAQEHLVDQDCSKLRIILGRWAPPDAHYDDSSMGARLNTQLGRVFLDPATAKFACELMECLTKYRENLFAIKNPKRSLAVASIHDDIPWVPFDGKEATCQHPIGVSDGGLGFVSTIARIQPGFGAYHQHLGGPFPGAGMEFFAVLAGQGRLYCEHPVSGKWDRFEVAAGSCGQYRGSLGHCYLNDGGEPLYVFIVVVPFPPKLVTDSPGDFSIYEGYADGIEFRCTEVEDTTLPPALVSTIVQGLQEVTSG